LNQSEEIIMNLLRRKSAYPLAVVSLATALGGLGLVYAHPDGDGDGPGFGGRHHCRGGQHGRFGSMGRHVDGILAFVKTELKITAGQEPAWQEFSTAVRELARERTGFRSGMRDRAQDGSKDAPLVDRIDRRLAMMEQGTAHLRRMAEAVKSLYAELTPAQQQLADQLVPMGRM
jgi:hypothetical protein